MNKLEIILIILSIVAIGFMLVSYNSKINELEEEIFGYEMELRCISNNTYWHNFVISGDNVDFYIDAEKFVSFNGSLSFWLMTVGEREDFVLTNSSGDEVIAPWWNSRWDIRRSYVGNFTVYYSEGFNFNNVTINLSKDEYGKCYVYSGEIPTDMVVVDLQENKIRECVNFKNEK